MEKKHIKLVLLAIVVGALYTGYGLYQKAGKLGLAEIVVVVVTVGVALAILWVINKLYERNQTD